MGIGARLEEYSFYLFRMDEGADSGPILSQTEIVIDQSDDAKSLYDKLVVASRKQLIKASKMLIEDKVKWIDQDHSRANSWRKRGLRDGLIDFRLHSSTIYNLVRALTKPYVGAHLIQDSKEVKIWKTKIGPQKPSNLEPGKVLEINESNEVLVKTCDGSIWLVEHDFEDFPVVNSYL